MNEKTIISHLLDQGFTEVSRNSHIKFRAPDGRLLVIAATVGRGRALSNLSAQIVRMGYEPLPVKVGGRNKTRHREIP